MTQTTLAQRRQVILRAIQQHAKQPVELIAVSKRQDPSTIRELAALGQRMFGENYAQELSDKFEALKDLDLQWIFIGHIQSNKLKRIVEAAAEIQTVASLRHAEHIARHARDLGKTPYPIFIEVNAGNEAAKSGVPLAEAKSLADEITRSLPELRVRGLMAIPPAEYSDSTHTVVPELYSSLRHAANSVGEGLLSLGMSNDLRLALEAGSNFVRVGTALMGERA